MVLGLELFIVEIFRFEIILDPIEVPEDIAKLGYTGIVVAEKLTDAAIVIELETRELSAQVSWHKDVVNTPEVGTNARIQDISVPGSSFTIRSIARFIRQELDLHADYLRGEIVHEGNGLTLTLRNLSDAKVPAVRISKKEVEQLFQEGGAALLQLTIPSALAIHAYHKFKNQLSNSSTREKNYTQAVQLFEYCLKYPPTTDDPLVLYLWGNALRDIKRPDEAIKQYRKAICIAPKYVYAYNNLGNALLELNRPEEAIEQFRQANYIDPEDVYIYNNWSNALLDLKPSDPEGAIAKYRKAIEINPKFTLACNNWSYAIQYLKHPEELIKEYHKECDLVM